MLNALGLLKRRRFLPLFATQFLGAFNDNLFKTSMVLFATYQIFNSERAEGFFNALVGGLFVLPFFLFSALGGQLADTTDKTRIVRVIKLAEIAIMAVGGAGLMLARTGAVTLPLALMLMAVVGLGVHSTFFGPIKYAILPQHLRDDDVLGGTGLVEAGTYLAVLFGTILAGVIYRGTLLVAGLTVVIALCGWRFSQEIPPAPRQGAPLVIDWNPFTASRRLVAGTMHVPRLFLAICAISLFWTIGTMLYIAFPPLVKNVLTAQAPVASLVLGIFSVGVAIGSVVINLLLRGRISARFSPASVIAMALAVVGLWLAVRGWTPAPPGRLYGAAEFVRQPQALAVLGSLLAVAVFGGMFVVPLYAFLTTTVSKDHTARTVAANNVVNSGAMTAGSVAVAGLMYLGMSATQLLLLAAALCIAAAWIAQRLHLACDLPTGERCRSR